MIRLENVVLVYIIYNIFLGIVMLLCKYYIYMLKVLEYM